MWAVQLTPIEKFTLSLDSAAIASSLDEVPLWCDFVHSRVIGRRSTLIKRTVAIHLPLAGMKPVRFQRCVICTRLAATFFSSRNFTEWKAAWLAVSPSSGIRKADSLESTSMNSGTSYGLMNKTPTIAAGIITARAMGSSRTRFMAWLLSSRFAETGQTRSRADGATGLNSCRPPSPSRSYELGLDGASGGVDRGPQILMTSSQNNNPASTTSISGQNTSQPFLAASAWRSWSAAESLF